MNSNRLISALVFALALPATSIAAQSQTKDAAVRLREVLPSDVAERVIARIADARAHQLPVDALENRALKFAARGVDPVNIERSVAEQAVRMQAARTALLGGRSTTPADDEVEAGADAMRKGIAGADVSRLARSAPSGRSLAVPLYVIGSLTERGLPSDEALNRVLERLKQRATDNDLESLPGDSGNSDLAPGHSGERGREFGQSHKKSNSGRPSTAGPPSGIPGNGASKHVKSVNTHGPGTKGHK